MDWELKYVACRNPEFFSLYGSSGFDEKFLIQKVMKIMAHSYSPK